VVIIHRPVYGILSLHPLGGRHAIPQGLTNHPRESPFPATAARLLVEAQEVREFAMTLSLFAAGIVEGTP
jgi:hypothetical protein